MRRLILFLKAWSRYLSHVGTEDFNWVNHLLIPAYREIQGADESAHNSSDSTAGICAVRAFTTAAVLFEKKGPTHACRNTG